MKKLIFLFIVITFSFCSTNRILNEGTLEKIKSRANWKSYDIHENPFKEYTNDQIKNLLGVKLTWDENNIHMLLDNDDHDKIKDLPKSFDFRTQWPKCVKEIRNQEHCGSCWAFSGTSVLSDRFCIASNGVLNMYLSPQDSVSCDSGNYGCHGGVLNQTWKYFEKVGVVSDKCFPYASGDGKNVPHCLHGSCVDEKDKYVKYRAEAASSKSFSCAPLIKEELFKNGPVQTGFIVYEDFLHYKEGIYEYTHGNRLGGHAVVIIGWGEEEGKEYWIVENSWGPAWGEKGYFRIKFGECFIEENAYAGKAKINDFAPNFLYFHDH